MNRRGSVLILIAWTITLLSVLIAGLGARGMFALNLTDRLNCQLEASYIASAGVQEALRVLEDDASTSFDGFSDRWANTLTLSDHPVGEGAFTIAYLSSTGRPVPGVLDEERKLNLNTAPADVVRRLFEQVGLMKERDAEVVADAVLDWRDENKTPEPYGAEDFYYLGLTTSYESKDAPFENVEELALVRGVTPEAFASVAPFVTVYGSGAVNLNTASPQVLAALGMSEVGVSALEAYRRGEDDVQGTEDDRALGAVSAIGGELGSVLPSEDVNRLVSLGEEDVVGVKSEAFHAMIDAHAANPRYPMQVECVIGREGQIFAWAER